MSDTRPTMRAMLLHYLHVHCRGAEYAMPGRDLAKVLTRQAQDAGLSWRFTERRVRRLVDEVRDERNPQHLIGSSTETPSGYFIIERPEEWERVSAQLWHRVTMQRETAQAMEDAAALKFGEKQLTFRFREVG